MLNNIFLGGEGGGAEGGGEEDEVDLRSMFVCMYVCMYVFNDLLYV